MSKPAGDPGGRITTTIQMAACSDGIHSAAFRSKGVTSFGRYPEKLPPRGLSRTEAAAYIGVSPTLFDMMVKDGRMPNPKNINSRTVWDIRRLDKFFDELPSEDDFQALDE